MAYSDDTSNLNKIKSQQWKNINLVSPSETIRILLFKECKLSDRRLIYDSHLSQNEENKSKDDKKVIDEFSKLTEMIFGSTAMKYHETYYKMYSVSLPDRLIFTQVFSAPNKLDLQIHANPSLTNFDTDLNIVNNDVSSSSLSSNSKIDSILIFRKNNSTSATIDSGFSESSFSSNLSSRSFPKSKRSENSCTSLNTSLSDTGCYQNVKNLRLGLALVVPVASETNERKTMYIQHITYIESILWRIRQYIELALASRKQFLATMLEISSISARWLSKELNFWTSTSTNQSKSIVESFLKRLSLIFGKKRKDEHFDKFCRTLNELDAKETKFFLSALLTSVLTHHTSWVASCYPSKQINLDDSYHAIWMQLTNLHGASGYLTKISRTVIYGLKDTDRVRHFLQYFIRFFKVKRRYLERVNILEENDIVDDICDKINLTEPVVESNKGITKTKTFGLQLNMLNDLDEGDNSDDEEYRESPVLFILGDNDKLQNLNKQSEESIRANKEEYNERKQIKLKVIKFPLPKTKPVGDFCEVIPYEYLSENDFKDNYVPDKIFQTTSTPEKNWKHSLKVDLSLKKSCLFPNQVEENVAILANTDNWVVQVLSSNRQKTENTVDSSTLISNMLEVFLQMWKLNMSKSQCATFLEHSLIEICLKSDALSQFLLSNDFCTMENLLNALKLNLIDVPLLMAVGSNINPDILHKYGISYQ